MKTKVVVLFCCLLAITLSACQHTKQQGTFPPKVMATTPLPCLDTQLRLSIIYPISNTLRIDSFFNENISRRSSFQFPFGAKQISGTISSNLSISGSDSELLVQAIRPGEGTIRIKGNGKECSYHIAVAVDTPDYWQHVTTALSTHDPFIIFNDSLAHKFSQAMFLNRALPDKGLRDMEGKPFTPAQFKGKISVLAFWYYGCAACEKLREPLNEMALKYENPEVAFYAVCKDTGFVKSGKPHFQATRTMVKTGKRDTAFMPEYWAGTNLICGAPLSTFLYGYGYPSILILDAEGVIRYCFGGYHENIAEDIAAAIRFLSLTKKVYVREES